MRYLLKKEVIKRFLFSKISKILEHINRITRWLGMSFMLSNGVTDTNSTNNSSLSSYAALSVSVVLWGVNYVPVKQFETGDGFFFQFMFGIAVWSSGFVVYFIKGIKNFYWLAMLGGMLWSLSNLFTVPVIKLIGIGLGMLMWNSSCLLLGWAVPRFGL